MRALTSTTGGMRGLVAGAALTALALLAACGGGEQAKPAPTASKTATAATTPAATAKATATAASTGTPKAAATSTPSATTLRVGDTALGKVLVDEKGMTLYTFKNDPTDASKSACNGNCAAIWPPLAAPASGSPTKPAEASGAIAVVTRDDGSKQVAYGGLPLYRYQADSAPGETKGEGAGGNWTVARP
jgi:predicted lipoprotein with Yx(FWY)xxD motif